jgi:hypothetical protein
MEKEHKDNAVINSSDIISTIGKALISFYSFDEKFIFQNQYYSEETIGEIIDDFLKKNSEEFLKKILNVKYFNKNNLFFYVQKDVNKFEKIVYYNATISSIFFNIQDTIHLLKSSSTDISKLMLLKIYIIHKHLKLAEKSDEYIIKKTYLIGKPIFNTFKYYLYDKNIKKLRIIKYSMEDINSSSIKCLSTIDSYCNAMNSLYLYQSNSENTNFDNFFKIDLFSNKINLISSKFPKRILHSMIYIPKYYIFIIGGKKEKEVIKYNINTDNENYKKYRYLLPYELIEPSLIFVNSRYLYAFENSTFEFHILRTDLKYITPFEDIKLANSKFIPMNQKFFGVVKSNNTIIFLGGQMINSNKEFINNCYEYDYNNDKLIISKREFKSFYFIEKTFIPVSDGLYMQIAEYKNLNKYEPKVIFFEVKKYFLKIE